MTPVAQWTELAAQQLVRYQALFTLLDDIQQVEDIDAISARIATQWKYFANVTNWRMVIANGLGFQVIDGFRGEAQLADVSVLSPWDKHHWALQRPEVVRSPDLLTDPAPPPHLLGKSTTEVTVLPFFRMGRCVGLLSASASHGTFSELDDKFIRLFGGHFADRICGILLQRQAIEALTARATRDALTNLANRAVFVEAVQHAIAPARQRGRRFAVLYLDLDHFKDVNDTMGHPIGDLLLQSVGQRLETITRSTDTVARFGGDEFALIQTDIVESADAVVLADKVLKAVSEPYSIQGNEIRTGVSVGIAVYGQDAPDAETLLSHADVALYRAKSEGRGTYRFFTDAMDTEVRTRVMLGDALRTAIASSQLFLVYQPQVDIDSGRIVGLEALIRWRHPQHGVIVPSIFIPVAERSGLIVSLGQWVRREACRQMKTWIDAGVAPPLISVNVSALEFKTPHELETDIAAVLAQTGVPPTRVEFELTESVLMTVSREHNDVLLGLRKSGLRIAIDDFGTGYSSLDYLGRFPVDRIKIAQNFIFDLTSNSSNATIVKAAVGLAHELKLDVVVEGVETAAQLELVRSWGCHKVQGFYFSKPMLADEITPALQAGKIVPGLCAPSQAA